MQPNNLQDETPNLGDLFRILRRRKWGLILPALVIFLIAAAVALVLPSIYESTSTILIEESQVPSDFVKTTVSGYAAQRMDAIKQRIVSFSSLNSLVDKFDLYPDLRHDWTREQIVNKMRKDIQIDAVNGDVTNPRSGRSGTATIAFTVSYRGKNPAKVQQVASSLTSSFLEENLQARTSQAKGTTQFLEDEMKDLKNQLAALDARIAAFKERHINELPQLLQTNLETRERIARNIDQLSDQLRTDKERVGFLETELAAIPPPGAPSGGVEAKRLADLKLLLVNLKTQYTDEYPDVIKTKKEIADLEKQMAASNSKKAHVVHTSQEDLSDNPAYITLASQLTSTRLEMTSLIRQIKDLQKKEEVYRSRVENTPKVENIYNTMEVERNNTQVKFNELMSKYMEARVALGLEKEQKGERLSLIDPPQYPHKPVKPNRPAILLIGFVLAIGAGLGTTALREYSDQSVRDVRRLSAATPFPVLASIPEITTRRDIIRRRLKRIYVTAAVLVILGGGVAVLNFYVMNLDVLWAKLMIQFSHFFA